MTQYITLNINLSYSQLYKLKSGIKNGSEVTLNLSSNVIGNSNAEYNFPHKLLLTNTQVLRLCKAYANNSSVDIKSSGWFLGKLLGSLLKTDLPLMKSLLKPLAKSVLIPLGLTAAASVTDAAVQNNIFGSGMTTLTISNEEMNDIMKIVISLEEPGLLIKGVSQTIKNEAKEQKLDFSVCCKVQ